MLFFWDIGVFVNIRSWNWTSLQSLERSMMENQTWDGSNSNYMILGIILWIDSSGYGCIDYWETILIFERIFCGFKLYEISLKRIIIFSQRPSVVLVLQKECINHILWNCRDVLWNCRNSISVRGSFANLTDLIHVHTILQRSLWNDKMKSTGKNKIKESWIRLFLDLEVTK